MALVMVTYGNEKKLYCNFGLQSPYRVFQNPFSDLALGQEVEIKRELWETRIRSEAA